ncbi:DUF2569 family protein [Alloacidobacterium dinghuense]|uniref:DUF2569 family protein n=1 Tax=Alloacidobacterium dinghuense TaxID=2763107 RepID=A0A7G8BJC8_9BACT|nr:DUF2569 family protein [Alloacidobacterium dinghuense]QNI32648.1 DUF2569 family protein [Alloacidobacterium dinghuense]
MGSADQDVQTSHYGYGGWLAFLCFCLIFLSPAVWVLSLLVSAFVNTRDYPYLRLVTVLFLIVSLIFVGVGILAGVHLRAGSKFAVKFTKGLLVACVLWRTLAVVITVVASDGLPKDAPGNQLFAFIVGTCVCGAWFAYLTRSKRVKAMFSVQPSEQPLNML